MRPLIAILLVILISSTAFGQDTLFYDISKRQVDHEVAWYYQ